MLTVVVMIENSDDKLTQALWSKFVEEVRLKIGAYTAAVHGSWVSPSASRWQNAAWCFEVNSQSAETLRAALRRSARSFAQDSIAWMEGTTEMLLAADAVDVRPPASRLVVDVPLDSQSAGAIDLDSDPFEPTVTEPKPEGWMAPPDGAPM